MPRSSGAGGGVKRGEEMCCFVFFLLVFYEGEVRGGGEGGRDTGFRS